MTADPLHRFLKVADEYNCYRIPNGVDTGLLTRLIENLSDSGLLRTPPTQAEIEDAAEASYESSGPKPVPWENTPEEFKQSYRRDVTVILNTYIKGKK